MRCEKTIARVAVSLGLLLAAGDAAYAVRVDRVVGATSSGGSYLVKRFSVPAGSVVVGAELVTNDLRTAFPNVLLLKGQGRALGNFHRSAEIRNVRAVSRHVLQVAFPALIVDQQQDVYVAVGLPPNTGARSVGDGPGLGALSRGSGDCYIASADDGTLQPLDVDLCIRLLFQGVGKAETGGIPAVPASVSIDASPNPFNPMTAIAFTVPVHAVVELSIYSVSGRVIRSLAHDKLAPGSYSREWDGRDEVGRSVSGGVYIAKLQVDDIIVTRRIVLVK